MTELALVVPFAGLAPVVDELRERTCVTKPSHGMPPHVTLLDPAPADVEAIAAAVAPARAFDVVFARFDRFPGTLWLAPEPASPFRELTAALVRRFPQHQPYGGAFAEVIPHLTVAQSDFDAAVHEVEEWLPLGSRVERILLLERVQAEHWRELAAFELEEP